MLFVAQGSYFKRLIVPQTLLFIFSFIIYYYQTHIAKIPVPLNPSVFALLGISLAIFHAFCNNAAYDRFWEGRKLWGTLVWLSRNVTREVMTLPNVSLADKQAFIRHHIAFVHSLRLQLRSDDNTHNLQRLLQPEEQKRFVGQSFAPLRINQAMGQMLADWKADGRIDDTVIHAEQHARDGGQPFGIVGGGLLDRVQRGAPPCQRRGRIHDHDMGHRLAPRLKQARGLIGDQRAKAMPGQQIGALGLCLADGGDHVAGCGLDAVMGGMQTIGAAQL